MQVTNQWNILCASQGVRTKFSRGPKNYFYPFFKISLFCKIWRGLLNTSIQQLWRTLIDNNFLAPLNNIENCNENIYFKEGYSLDQIKMTKPRQWRTLIIEHDRNWNGQTLWNQQTLTLCLGSSSIFFGGKVNVCRCQEFWSKKKGFIILKFFLGQFLINFRSSWFGQVN